MPAEDKPPVVSSEGDPGQVAPGERRWVCTYAVLLLLVTSVPYVLGYFSAGEDWRFTGFVFGVEDGNSYIAKMLSGSAGAWLFRSPYTALPQKGFLAFLPYLLLGKLAAGSAIHEQLVALFHIFRLGAGFLSIWATYDFLSFFLKNLRLRRLGMLLVTIGGGLGWILLLLGKDRWLGSLPLEFYSPESFGFLGIYGIPHLVLGRAMLLWCLLAFFKTARSGTVNLGDSTRISALWLLAGLAQPLDALVIGYVIVLYLCVEAVGILTHPNAPKDWSRWKGYVRLSVFSGILPGLFVLYNGVAFLWDPYLSAWAEQNIIRSPHPLHYLIAFGLAAPFAWIGSRRLVRSQPIAIGTLAVWVLSLPFLAYLPFNLQRRLPEGIWVALVVLAMGFFLKADTNDLDPKRAAWTNIFLLLFPSTLLLLVGGTLAAMKPSMPVFRPVQEIEAFEYLAGASRHGEVVLAGFDTSNAIPSWAPLRVLIGHGPESAHLAQIQPEVEAFYAPGTPEEARRSLIEQFSIRYIFWGPNERQLGSWDPNTADYLEKIYSQGDVMIFIVSDSGG